MVVPFGISVGDFLAVIELVNDIFEALNESRGSAADFARVLRQIKSLKKALEALDDFEDGKDDTVPKDAILSVAAQAQQSVQRFGEQLARYDSALSLSQKPKTKWWKDKGALKTAVKRIQWSRNMQEEVRKFETELFAHAGSLQLLLAKANATSASANRKQLVKIANSQEQQKMAQAVVIRMLNNCWEDLRDLLLLILSVNLKIFNVVVTLSDKVDNLPQQILFDQPVVFIDANLRRCAISLQWTDSWDLFEYALKRKYPEERSLKKIDFGEYALLDMNSDTDISRRQPFTSCFIPGRTIAMEMVLINISTISDRCPRCAKVSETTLDSAVYCEACDLHYRRTDPLVGSIDSKATNGILPRQLQGSLEPDQGRIRDYSRVRLTSATWQTSKQHLETLLMRRRPGKVTEEPIQNAVSEKETEEEGMEKEKQDVWVDQYLEEQKTNHSEQHHHGTDATLVHDLGRIRLEQVTHPPDQQENVRLQSYLDSKEKLEMETWRLWKESREKEEAKKTREYHEYQAQLISLQKETLRRSGYDVKKLDYAFDSVNNREKRDVLRRSMSQEILDYMDVERPGMFGSSETIETGVV